MTRIGGGDLSEPMLQHYILMREALDRGLPLHSGGAFG